jgi:gliding motility-associated-like protein
LVDTLSIRTNAGADAMSCNGTLVPIGSAPKPGLSYAWSPTTGLNDPNISNPVAGPLTTTSYVLSTRSTGGGCLTTDTVIVRASVIDSAVQVLGRLAYCIGSGDSTVLKVQPTDSIQWYRDSRAITGATRTTYRATQAGSYHAMLFNNSGCTIGTKPVSVFIDQPQAPMRYPVLYAIVNLPLNLQARPIGENILWTPPTFLSTRTSYTPLFTGSRDMLYTITLTTNTGCVTVDTQLVKTIKNVEVFVPTAFTPNNDGRNDLLRPVLKGIKRMNYFRVYNRWGQLLYESKDEQNGWNGTYKGLPQQTQAVVWVFEGVGVDNKTYIQKGTTVLMR